MINLEGLTNEKKVSIEDDASSYNDKEASFEASSDDDKEKEAIVTSDDDDGGSIDWDELPVGGG